MIDLDAYLERIGLAGRPGLAEVHRAHATSIPFENLDPHGGRPVSLAPKDLEEKLVRTGRGGYCFEQNMLLKAALEALGAEVEMYLARVRLGATADAPRPRSHLVLRVRSEGQSWLADVGFGSGTQLDPLPFAPAGEQVQSGWRYRLVEDGPELVLQTAAQDGWVDVHGFLPHAVPPIDVETINWWVCTHPSSPFVSGLLVGAQDDDGARVILSDWSELALSERTPERTLLTPLQRSQIPAVLASRFGLDGFELGDDGRVRRAS